MKTVIRSSVSSAAKIGELLKFAPQVSGFVDGAKNIT